MKELRSKGHLLGLTIYVGLGIFFLINAGMIVHANTAFIWGGVMCWWIGSLIMVFTIISDSIPSYAFETVYIIFSMLFAFWTQLLIGTEFFILQALILEWLVVVSFLDKYMIHLEAIMQICLFFATFLLPNEIFKSNINIKGIPTAILIAIVADWVAQNIVKGVIQMYEENLEHERSLDDLLEIVEAKHNEAKEATRAKSSFLSNMSHEIRTPINAVLGIDEMILRESNENNIKNYARDIKNSGNVLLSLVNDILDISKIEEGRMELLSVDFSLKAMVANVKNMINTHMSNKGLNFVVNIEESLPSVFNGDDVRLTQILINLLTNAAKYTHEGSVTFSISGQRVGKDEILHFAVKDTGIGIKAEDIKKLNDKFVRFDEEKNRFIEGTGLGITIVNAFLSMMGSELNVESEYGKGSTFSFDVKMAIVDETPISMASDSYSNLRRKNEFFEAPNAKVLVVDDNSLNIKVFVGLLKRTKVQIDTAFSGREAVELGKKKKYDVVFMDHMMPEMDGIEAMKQMKGIGEALNAETPFVALTANAVAGISKMYIEAGFSDYLAKPVQPEILEDMLKLYVGGIK